MILPEIRMEGPAAPATRRRRKEARPGEIIDAALTLFVERGFAATRLEDVAAAAGIGKGTLYLYFDSKESLLAAAVQRDVAPLFEEFERQALDADTPRAELIARVALRWWQALSGEPRRGIPKLMLAESGNFPGLAREYVARYVAPMQDRLLASVLRSGIARGEFTPVDVEYAVKVLVHGLVFLPVWMHSLGQVDERPFDPERYLRCWVEMSLRALGVRATPVDGEGRG